MKKRIVSMFLVLAMVFSCITSVMAEETQEDKFVVLSIAYPEGEDIFKESYSEFSRLCARFKDDGAIIPMSRYYDGYMYATVPKEYKDREIEAFVAPTVEFSDYNKEDYEHSYEFTMMEMAAEIDVIRGDENGAARPFDNITRAEATAIIMRLLSLDTQNEGIDKFDDVKKDDWYYKVVSNAVKYDIVKGDSDKVFAPERNVSREEFTAMLARAIWSATLIDENKDVTYEMVKAANDFSDAEDISDWALSAYGTFFSNISSYQPTGEKGEYGEDILKTYAKPQQSATRAEAAELVFRAREYFQIYPSQIAKQFGFDKQMPVIDGSTSTYPFTQAVYRNLFSSGYYHPGKPEKHSKSHASYQRLINGEVDMIFASVYPASDILKMAEEKGVEIELIPIAYDAMVFFTNIDNDIKGLTKDEISKIYVDNAYENWKDIGGPDAILYPYCRNTDSGSHAQMEKHFLNGKEIHKDIANETTSNEMASIITDVMYSKTDNPVGYGLGYSIYYYYQNMSMFYGELAGLKLLEIDGVAPNDETIANGTYPLSNNTYIALLKDTPEDAPARKMAEFMLTALGQECVKEAGFGPLMVSE